MSTTPGQAAYEAFLNAHWDDDARVWDEIAQAAITAYAAQSGPWAERAAEILTEGQP